MGGAKHITNGKGSNNEKAEIRRSRASLLNGGGKGKIQISTNEYF